MSGIAVVTEIEAMHAPQTTDSHSSSWSSCCSQTCKQQIEPQIVVLSLETDHLAGIDTFFGHRLAFPVRRFLTILRSIAYLFQC